MLSRIKDSINKNKELILIILFLLSLFIVFKSHFFLPVIVSVILSHFLNKILDLLKNFGINEKWSFILTYFLFLTIFSLIFLILLPGASKQIFGLFNDLPIMIQKIKILIHKLTERYPLVFTYDQTNFLFSNIISYAQSFGKTLITASIISVLIITKWILYIFLIPILVFFFLKDQLIIIKWFRQIMPEKTSFLEKIWNETHKQMENYIRGKMIEFFLITLISLLLFKFYNLIYYDLFALLVGFSVLIPYIGTIIISIPIMFISMIQFGISQDFLYFNLIYIFIQFIDGNVLVPVLFSEAVNLHPLSIILSVIVFGFIFSFYGIIFAIPLGVLIKAIINLYLTQQKK